MDTRFGQLASDLMSKHPPPQNVAEFLLAVARRAVEMGYIGNSLGLDDSHLAEVFSRKQRSELSSYYALCIAKEAPATSASRRATPRVIRNRGPRARVRKVVVIHGRDERARLGLFQLLRSLGLSPVEWNQAVRATGEGAPFIGTILEAMFHTAAAVVVLITPDDEARLRKEFHSQSDPKWEGNLTGQARPNVLFEAGMAFGRNPSGTVLVQVGEVRPFTDVLGRHVLRWRNTPECRRELATKLENAGCCVDTSGVDWLSAGDLPT